MRTYHILITEGIKGEPKIFITETEPAAYSGRMETGDDERTYYIYGTVNLYPLLLIDIGRAIENRERGSSAT
jgi:hypothetical protein